MVPSCADLSLDQSTWAGSGDSSSGNSSSASGDSNSGRDDNSSSSISNRSSRDGEVVVVTKQIINIKHNNRF